jgi:hypothetical protein
MAARTPITGTRNGLEIVEEAVHVLRLAPLRIWALYLIGAVPFCLAFTYFIADMSRSAFASEQVIESSFFIALAFEWKQVWQGVFTAEIYAELEGSHLPWTSPRIGRMIALQCALQPLSLIVLPLAALTAFPFAYAVGLFRNVTLFAGLGRDKPVRLARQHTALWPAQAWIALSVFALLALLLFINYLATLAIVPQLLKSFFGIENSVTRYSEWVLNATVMTATAALVYLTLDVLLDAVYVLRCFYGESIANGIDLRAGLRRAMATAAVLCCLIGMFEIRAAPAGQQPSAIDQEKLQRSIDETVHRREFTWNSPKTVTEREESKFVGWVNSVWKSIKRFFNSVVDWIEKTFFPEDSLSGSASGEAGGTKMVRWLLIAFGTMFAVVILYIFYRQRKAAARRVHAKPAVAAPVIDLKDESVTADQLPEDSWYSLAHEWIGKGDFRLALRALYLGAISHLGQRELVTIERWKSGLDYSRELGRRTRATPQVAPAFSKIVRLFERGWYGRHTVDRSTLEEFTAGFEEVRRGAK